MTNSELRELILKAQEGDIASMERVLKIFQPLLYKHSLENGVVNEDCLQELSIKLIQCVKSFKFNRM